MSKLSLSVPETLPDERNRLDSITRDTLLSEIEVVYSQQRKTVLTEMMHYAQAFGQLVTMDPLQRMPRILHAFSGGAKVYESVDAIRQSESDHVNLHLKRTFEATTDAANDLSGRFGDLWRHISRLHPETEAMMRKRFSQMTPEDFDVIPGPQDRMLAKLAFQTQATLREIADQEPTDKVRLHERWKAVAVACEPALRLNSTAEDSRLYPSLADTKELLGRYEEIKNTVKVRKGINPEVLTPTNYGRSVENSSAFIYVAPVTGTNPRPDRQISL